MELQNRSNFNRNDTRLMRKIAKAMRLMREVYKELEDRSEPRKSLNCNGLCASKWLAEPDVYRIAEEYVTGGMQKPKMLSKSEARARDEAPIKVSDR